MKMDELGDIIQKILNPVQEDADVLLEETGLGVIPSSEAIHQEIESKLLSPPDTLPEHWLSTYQIHWKHDTSIPSLLSFDPAPPPTSLTFIRTGIDGRPIGYAEVPNPRIATALTSTSMERAPAPPSSFVRGKSGYVPFKPGGLDDVLLSSIQPGFSEEPVKGLRSIPPGFSRGLRRPGEELEDESLATLEESLSSKAIANSDLHKDFPTEDDERLESGIVRDARPIEVDELLPANRSHLRPPKARGIKRAKVTKRDWAHEVDINKPMTNFRELVPEMAHKYPFELDTFQKEAVYHLEMGDSVFVAAHTSAGKTVVAEYAIALAEKHMTRAIYTSPIKALSNQKFRDFKQTFGASSVGILTGDVQINPEANCLVMTTEILRSMLYKGADLIRDVEFVIFDEVHYVNDAERGVVWEEVIIMLPDHISIILLSATVPNTKEFADWVGRTKKKDIYVISTAKRPVPLEHYIYAGRDIFKIVDSKRTWVPEGYKEACEALKRKQDKEREAAGLPQIQRGGARGAAQKGQRGSGGRGNHLSSGSGSRGRGGGGPSRTIHTGADKNLYVHLVNNLQKKGLLPVVVFTLSKKKCEENAATLSNVDLCVSAEKSEVHVTIEKALSRLKGSDKKLPQIAKMRSLLSRGIGVHHGGLLPIVKEVVEILFARGLVKVLFATETFAMGVNMPAKCVVFSGIRKHDGRAFRHIMPGEYTQMAGRAGRRGLDTTGTVIIVAGNELPDQADLRTMILGTPAKLQSQFRLTYNMILNLLRVEALRVEEMIKRSFSENTSQRRLPENQKKVMEHERMLSSLPKLECDICLNDIERHYDGMRMIIDRHNELLRMAATSPSNQQILSPGRVVILRDSHFYPFNVAIILKPDLRDRAAERKFFVLALVERKEITRSVDVEDDIPPRWHPNATLLRVESAAYKLESIPLSSISLVTSKTFKVDISGIVDSHKKSLMLDAINYLQTTVQEWVSAGGIPELSWGRMRQLEFQESLRERDEIFQNIKNSFCTQCPHFDDHYVIFHGEKSLRASIDALKAEISEQNLDLIPDYEQRIAVLKELNFIDENSTVQLKGRVACEINSVNELILTELILENTLANYDPEEVVALLSGFVFQEKADVELVIPPKLSEGIEAIIGIADRVLRVQEHHQISAEEFRSTLKFGLVEVVYEWAKGMPFDQIMALTEVPEGTIVRVITRLDETCREVRDAARVIGDAELFKKMEEAQVKIKRDIVFAASLYF